jgi:hypothetical protein
VATTYYLHNGNVDVACDLGGGVVDNDLRRTPDTGSLTVDLAGVTSYTDILTFDFLVDTDGPATGAHTTNIAVSTLTKAKIQIRLEAIDSGCSVLASTSWHEITGSGTDNFTHSSLTWGVSPEAVRLRLHVQGMETTDHGTREVIIDTTSSSYVSTTWTTAAPNLAQTNFRGRNDDGNETSATWIANENTDWTQDTDEDFRVRFALVNASTTTAINQVHNLQYRKNGGTWTNVTTSSSNVKAVATGSPGFADGDDCSEQITTRAGYTYQSTNAGCSDDGSAGGANMDWNGQGAAEFEYSLQIVGSDVADEDTIELRVIKSGTTALDNYVNIPLITVNKPVSATGRITELDADLTSTEVIGRITELDADLTRVDRDSRITELDADLTSTEVTGRVTELDADLTSTETTGRVTELDADLTTTEVTARITAVDADMTTVERDARVTELDADVTSTEVTGRVTEADADLTSTEVTARITEIDSDITYQILGARITELDADVTSSEIIARITELDADATSTEVTARITELDADATWSAVIARVTELDADVTASELTGRITELDADVTSSEIIARITELDADETLTEVTARITEIDADATYSVALEGRIVEIDADITTTEVAGRIVEADADVTYTETEGRITEVDLDLTYETGLEARITSIEADVTFTPVAGKMTVFVVDHLYTEVGGRVTEVDADETFSEITARITEVDSDVTSTEVAARIVGVDADLTTTEVAARVTELNADAEYYPFGARVTALAADVTLFFEAEEAPPPAEEGEGLPLINFPKGSWGKVGNDWYMPHRRPVEIDE